MLSGETVYINGDFRVFTDMIERWCAQYRDVPGAREPITNVVREWFEQALIEAVLGAHDRVRLVREGQGDRRIVRTEMDGGSQPQPHFSRSSHEPEGDVYGVL